jgi:hypothetical protein
MKALQRIRKAFFIRNVDSERGDRRDGQRGAVVAYVAVILPVVLGGLGLAIDNGRLYAARRQMQTAADATAIAAAHEWRQQNHETYAAEALDDALLNGYAAGPDTEIQINTPPVRGPRAGDSEYVEVIIREHVPLYFMRAFSRTSTVVESRAVAGLVPTDACIYILDPVASNALLAAGDAKLTLEGCGIHVNSIHSSAARTMGGGEISASAIGVAGNYNGTGFFPTPQTDVYQTPDPLADLPSPAVGACTSSEPLVVKTEMTIDPGVYCGGIEVSGTGDLTLNAGMYVINGGGLKVQANGDLTGENVMIYVTEGDDYGFEPVVFAATSTSILSAPTSGTYKGILFFQDRVIDSRKEAVFAGTPDTLFTGVLYFPNADIRYVGTSGTIAQESLLLARTAEFRGTADVRMFARDADILPTALAVARVVE